MVRSKPETNWKLFQQGQETYCMTIKNDTEHDIKFKEFIKPNVRVPSKSEGSLQ